ncbi:hypothetical protein [Streptomyces sp. NPDC058202]|uniref:hypothetical protein n=1 Tax=Streptomyces sp. NPDC058202 TaxID=3346380 RepID=UPI0036E52487
MVTLTRTDALIIGAMGGVGCGICLAVLFLVAFGLAAAYSRLYDRLEARRARRTDLKACRAIDALGTLNHPKD